MPLRFDQVTDEELEELEVKAQYALKKAKGLFEEALSASAVLVSTAVPPAAFQRPRHLLVFLSDGHDCGEDPIPVAAKVRRLGVEIHTIGGAGI